MFNSIIETIAKTLPAINKEGYAMIAIFFLITILFFACSEPLGWICLILTLWCIFFFRDPTRIIPDGENLIISPADGIVQSITRSQMPIELGCDDDMHRVSIFLNVFDVHVNRIPIGGEIKKMHYRHGKFINASLDKASIDNERQSVLINRKNEHVGLVQIAGLVARRIVCNLVEKQTVQAGDRFGIIKFGSRVDLYLPLDIAIKVKVGQRMIGGETIIAEMRQDGTYIPNITSQPEKVIIKKDEKNHALE